MAVTLADYILDLQDAVHDPDERFWSEAQQIRYINRARLKRDLDLGGFRQTITYSLVASQHTYAFSAVTSQVVLDVVGIVVINGNARIVLNEWSFTDLNTWIRTSTVFQYLPAAFARYGDHSVVFAPTPGIAYPTEWDVLATQAAMVNPADTDALQEPYCRPVVFYAMYLGKMNERKYEEAAWAKAQYAEEMLAVQGSRLGTLPAPYAR